MLLDDLRKLPLRDLNIAIGVAILAATLNSLWVIRELYETHQMLSRASAHGMTVCFSPDYHLMFIRMVIALMTGVILLCSRRIIGLCFSALALLWVLLEYLSWYVWSQKLLEITERENFPEGMQHALGMSGATRWNAALLAIVGALFVWELKTIVSAFAVSSGEEKL
jgi:hypothetical protein